MSEDTKHSQNKAVRRRGYRWRTIKEIEAALIKHCGVVTATANELGMTRKAVYARLEKSAHLRKVRKEVEITITHKAEHNIYQRIAAGHVASSIFYLRTKGRDRGWGQDSNITIHNHRRPENYEIKPGMSAKEAAQLYEAMLAEE